MAQGATVNSEIGSYRVDGEPGHDGSGSGIVRRQGFSRPGMAR